MNAPDLNEIPLLAAITVSDKPDFWRFENYVCGNGGQTTHPLKKVISKLAKRGRQAYLQKLKKQWPRVWQELVAETPYSELVDMAQPPTVIPLLNGAGKPIVSSCSGTADSTVLLAVVTTGGAS